MADKQFCGNGKSFGQFGGIKVGLRAKDLPAPNDKGYINVIVSPMRDKPGEYYVAVDDWKPTQSQHATAPVTRTLADPEDGPASDDKDSLPF